MPVEFGKEIVRQKFRSKLNPKDFVAAIDYLVDSGALLIHKKGETWSLNPHVNEISREGARMAVSHVREIFLNR